MACIERDPPLAMLLLLLLIRSSVATNNVVGGCPAPSRVRFDPVSGCPTDSELLNQLLRALGPQSIAACLRLCSMDSACTAAALISGSCFIGSAFAPAWSRAPDSTPCRGFAKRPQLPPSLGVVCWFSFRYGLANLALDSDDGDVCAARAACIGAVCNASGAALAGRRDSRIEIATTKGGLQSRVSGQAFAVFVKVRRQRNSNQNTHYFRLMSSADASPIWAFLFETTSAKYQAFYSTASGSKFTTTGSPAPSGLTDVSVGMTSSAASGFQMFLQDGFQSMQLSSSITMNPNLVGDVIKLGHEPSVDAACLTGTVLCFAIANRSLTLDEFRLLADRC